MSTGFSRTTSARVKRAAGGERSVRERAAPHEMQALARQKDEFLATVSHELRTPLNAVLGWARLLADGRLPAEQVPAAIDSIIRNAEDQLRLVNDILDVALFASARCASRCGPLTCWRSSPRHSHPRASASPAPG